MANKPYDIHAVRTLPFPSTRKEGDVYFLQKNNNRYEAYVVQPDGTLAFNQGITDEQNSRLERLSSSQISKVESITTGDISKLKEDYTKAEIDTKITDLGNLATSSKINLGNSTVLPVPPQSEGVTIPNAWAELSQNVTYTQSGGSPITGIDGHRSIAEWDNDNEVWSLVDMGELPQVEGTDVLDPQGERIPKEKATAEYVKPLFQNTVEVVEQNLDFAIVEGFIHNNGATVTQTSWRRSGVNPPNIIPIQPDLYNYYYSGEISDDITNPSHNPVGVAYYDSELNFISSEFSSVEVYVNALLNPPINAAFIACCSYLVDPTIKSVGYVQKEPSSVSGDVIYGNIQTEQVIELERTKDFINTRIVEENVAQPLILTQGILTANGSTSTLQTRGRRTSNGQNLASIVHIQPDTDYYYTGKMSNATANSVGVQYHDIDQNYIGYEFLATSVETEYVRALCNLPPNAAYISTCSYDSDPIIEVNTKELIADKVLIQPNNSLYLYVDSINGNNDNSGDISNPFATITKAIQAIGNSSSAIIIVSQGDYRETIPTALLNNGKFKIVNREGHIVRVLGSNKLEGWTKTDGYDNVYDIPFTGTVPNWSRNDNPIFEDGNPSKPILSNEVHPLQKNLSYRLPFTPILLETSIENVDSNPSTYFVTGGRMYIHTSNSDNPETNGFSYENIARSFNTINNAVTTLKKVELEIKGIQFYFGATGFRNVGFEKITYINCVSAGSNSAGAFKPDTGFNHFINCEAAYCDGDGFNGHFNAFTGYQSLSDNRSNYPTSIYEQCWAHDNFDDGESSHENHNVVMLGSLLEYNGDSGCRPSNDATYHVSDCMFRYNGWEVGVGANRGEGFAVVNPSLSTSRKGCRAILYNCISYGNNMGYAAITTAENHVELINCTSRDNSYAEYFVNNGAKLLLRNCRGYNSNPSWIKRVATGTIEVINENIVE